MFSLISSRISCPVWYISYLLIQVSTLSTLRINFHNTCPNLDMSSGRDEKDQCAYWCLQLSLVGFQNPGTKVSKCCSLCLWCTSVQNYCCYAAIKPFSFQGGGNQAKLPVVPPALISLWSVAFWSLGMWCRLCLQYRMMTIVQDTLSGTLRSM